ncbi:serine hydrolase [Solirubrobacter soli]|uniref:serine hydrolase n=1 Tax=Solirubrobacter soli TaxID=363832 RepID=UPI000413E979|nr:serine hydrolase [Solirubrobacter soli]
MDFVAYHDRTSADHQAQFNSLYPQGYRMTSLSVYGARGDERYAAVWVKRAGPDWSAVHGVNAAGYQAAFDNAVANGFVPVLLAATGPATDPVFAGTFEQRPGPVPLTRHRLTRGDASNPGAIEHWIAQARANGWMPTTVAIYGTAPNHNYAAIWVDNPTGICWTMDGLDDGAGDHQQRFNALVPASTRPVHVAVAPDGRYASIFRDDRIGDCVFRHELTSAGYQQEFDRLVPQGFWPVSVQAGGVGAGARFAVAFAKQDQPLPLSWRAPTGPVANATIDGILQTHMQQERARGAALAIVFRNRLVYARGYACAEADYPAVLPTTFFRQASVSKTVIALAIHKLIQDGRLKLSTKVQSVLKLTQPNGTPPPAATFGKVTIQHLLEHRSGLPSNPYGVEPQVAAALGTTLPVSGKSTDRYMTTLPASPPPQPPAYNNWGYFLLGHVVMAVTGKPNLHSALHEVLLKPLSITGLRTSRTRAESQAADEARYHPTFLTTGPSLVEPDRRLRPTGSGGGYNYERDDGGGGLSASVVAIARLLAMLAVRNHNPVLKPASITNLFTLAANNGGHGFDNSIILNSGTHAYYGQKGGLLYESSQNCVRVQTDDFSIVTCWNRSEVGGTNGGWWYPDFPAVLTAARATTWSSTDLFPQFGMPTIGP